MLQMSSSRTTRRNVVDRTIRTWLLMLVLVLVVLVSAAVEESSSDKNDNPSSNKGESPTTISYGVDVSFPIHRNFVSNNYAWLPHNVDPDNNPTPPEYVGMPIQPLGNKQKDYDEFLNGCIEKFGRNGYRCKSTEQDRIEMSLRQPQSMQNYTEVGYKKIRAPTDLFEMLTEFYEKNKQNSKVEKWGVANTYTNNWKVDSHMVSVEDTSLRGGGYKLKQKIWNAAKTIISEWTGQELTQCSLYGIRVYKEGAILATHVDRLPLVSSAIINVAQDVDEPWPLEVIGHDGIAKNVTMEPGDMVLYESHSVLHGRPFPLKGRFMANVFVHFEPTGHSLRHNAEQEAKLTSRNMQEAKKKYRESLERGHGGHENDHSPGLPSYIIPGTPEEKNWRQQHPARSPGNNAKQASFTTGSTPVHQAAQQGNTKEVMDHIAKDKSLVNARDANGWTPLMESARSGHLEIVQYLYENGADVNMTSYHTEGTALWWAKREHDPDHPVIEFLESIGALDAGPEL